MRSALKTTLLCLIVVTGFFHRRVHLAGRARLRN